MREKLGLKEFLRIYGADFETKNVLQKPPLIVTTPEPFDLSDNNMQTKFYKFYLQQILTEKADKEFEHRFRPFKALQMPENTLNNIYQIHEKKADEKKMRQAILRILKRRFKN